MFDPAFTVFSGISLILVLLPVPLQWKARNAGTLLNLGWLFAGNLFFFVNGILWRNNTDNVAPVWCDISVKIHQITFVGTAASSLCINRRLASIASSRSIAMSQSQKRKSTWIDIVIGLGIPFIAVIFSYVFQPHRFDIIEGLGCTPVLWQSIGSLITVTLVPVLLCTVSAIFGAYAARFFTLRRLEVRGLLHNNGLDLSHYLRLLALAFTDVLFGLPLSLFRLKEHIAALAPWVSWDYVHAEWSRVGAVPDERILVSAELTLKFYMPRWFISFMSIIAFLYFGVGDDALREYWRWWDFLSAHIKTREKKKPAVEVPLPLTLGSSVYHSSGIPWDTRSADASTSPFDQGISTTQVNRKAGLEVAVMVQRETV